RNSTKPISKKGMRGFFMDQLLINLPDTVRTALKVRRQCVTKENFFTVRENKLLAETDRFAFGSRIHHSGDFHAWTQCRLAVSQSGQLADIAVLDRPGRHLSAVVLHIQKNGDMRIAPQHFL